MKLSDIGLILAVAGVVYFAFRPAKAAAQDTTIYTGYTTPAWSEIPGSDNGSLYA